MASATTAGKLNAGTLLAATLLACTAFSQTTMSLREAASRTGPDLRPAYEGQQIIVRGKVSARPIMVIDYAHLSIQEGSDSGLTLEGELSRFEDLVPGDVIEARGRVAHRGGLPVVHVTAIRKVSSGPVVPPKQVPLAELNSPRQLGLYIVTEGRVRSAGTNAGGHFLQLGDPQQTVTVFLPYRAMRTQTGLKNFEVGDRVRVRGLASQYCPLPPFDRFYQVLIGDVGEVELLAGHWRVPIGSLIAALVILVAAVAIFSVRERRMAAQRRVLRRVYRLGEEMTAMRSPAESLRRLREVLPKVLNVAGVRMYLYDRSSRLLRQAGTDASLEPAPMPDDAASEKAVSACYRNRTLLVIPDTHRSPFFSGGDQPAKPRSAIFVPMFAHNDLLGILEIHNDRVRHFSEDEQALAQHLGNQVAIGMKLAEQQAVREQLFRSEKLAVAGQLASSIAAELQAPLETIATLAEKLLDRPSRDAAEAHVRAIAATARSAGGIAERMLSLAGASADEASTADVTALVRRLLNNREPVWRQLGIHVRNLSPSEPVAAEISPKHLAQVILSLLSCVEDTISNGTDRRIDLRVTRPGSSVQLEIGYSAPGTDRDPDDPLKEDGLRGKEALGLGLCRSIVRGFGGDIRSVRAAGLARRFELELPSASEEAKTSLRKPAQPLTTLLLEPDPAARQKLMLLLGESGHRAVPAHSAEEAADLTERLRFHAMFCSTRPAGGNWVQVQERIRDRVEAFVLLAENLDTGLERSLQDRNGYVLAKPVEAAALERILALVEASLSKSEPGPPGAAG